MPPRAGPQAAKIHSAESTRNGLENKNLEDEKKCIFKAGVLERVRMEGRIRA